jgi:hypothetical protein
MCICAVLVSLLSCIHHLVSASFYLSICSTLEPCILFDPTSRLTIFTKPYSFSFLLSWYFVPRYPQDLRVLDWFKERGEGPQAARDFVLNVDRGVHRVRAKQLGQTLTYTTLLYFIWVMISPIFDGFS